MTLLKTIEAKLQEVLEPVCYGAADDSKTNTPMWKYIVFFRDRTSRSATNKGWTDYYTVAIIYENWMPVEIVEKVVEKMESISGVRLASDNIEYRYTRKPNTNAVVEVATLTFSHARKKVC